MQKLYPIWIHIDTFKSYILGNFRFLFHCKPSRSRWFAGLVVGLVDGLVAGTGVTITINIKF